jgi:hypothetical protein
MEIEVGDVFKAHFIFWKLYKVVKLENYAAHCRVYFEGRFLGVTLEHKNTLLNMQRLSKLEKELM